MVEFGGTRTRTSTSINTSMNAFSAEQIARELAWHVAQDARSRGDTIDGSRPERVKASTRAKGGKARWTVAWRGVALVFGDVKIVF